MIYQDKYYNIWA